MKQHPHHTAWYYFHVKSMLVISGIIFVVAITTSSFNQDSKIIDDSIPSKGNTDSVESAQAFLQVYKVLMSPRCMNCHPAADQPLQGDDSHTHNMNVQRGKDGKGLYALKCANCHQPENTPGLHMPPGNPKWQLPPADMKMVFEGKTAHELALQIMNEKTNGHKSKEQLLEHARDTLVKAGWNMGEGRLPPPLAYDEFLKAWDTWINKGGYAPGK